MDVSVIIVNYNTKQLLANCLESIYCKTRDVDFEVIVVDNASKDGSENYICSRFLGVVWINSGGNIGFGRANNLGAKHAKGKYLFLLNADTIIGNNALKFFLDYARQHNDEKIGALGCWMLDRNGNKTHSGGRFPSLRSELSYLFAGVKKSSKQLSHICYVDYIIGADLFIPKKVYTELQGFDKNFFMYFEETDLQYRMAERGYMRRLIDGPIIVHLEGGCFTVNGLTYNRFLMSQTSFNYYLWKHSKGCNYVVFKIFIIIEKGFLVINSRLSFKEKLKLIKLLVTGKRQL